MASYGVLGWNCVLPEFGRHYVIVFSFHVVVEKFYAVILILCMYTVLFLWKLLEPCYSPVFWSFTMYSHADLCPSIMLSIWRTFSLGNSLELFPWWFLLCFLIFSCCCLFFVLLFVWFCFEWNHLMWLSSQFTPFLSYYLSFCLFAEHSARIN